MSELRWTVYYVDEESGNVIPLAVCPSRLNAELASYKLIANLIEWTWE